MPSVLQGYSLAQQYVNSWLHTLPEKNKDALKAGILSSATVNAAALIHPAESHPDVIIYAIASRDPSHAARYASSYNIPHSYGSYEDLLADKDIDFVYISLPNSMHFEWACKSLDAGKHVLLEKPFTSNGREAAALVQKARVSGKVLLEAQHWRFHPAAHRFRELIASGTLGRITHTHAAVASVPPVPRADIRWKYNLSGGCLMDMSYALGFTAYALGAREPAVVLHARADASEDPRVDSAMQTTMRFRIPTGARPLLAEEDDSGHTEAVQSDSDGPAKKEDTSDVYSSIHIDFAPTSAYGILPRVWELPTIHVETTLAEVTFHNALMPHVSHSIEVVPKLFDDTTEETSTTTSQSKPVNAEAIYTGGPLWGTRGEKHWSSYRYQLEAFVDKVRGREPPCWVELDESLAMMETIDKIYRESGLPMRPTSMALQTTGGGQL